MIYFNFPGTKEQQDKLEILPRAETGKLNSGRERGTVQKQLLTACPVPSWGTKRDRAEKYVLNQKKDILKQKRTF